jgi:hypothetical protein
VAGRPRCACAAIFGAGGRRSFRWRFPSPEHQVSFFTSFYGPAHRAAATLSTDRAAELKTEMLDVVKRFNVSGDETLVLRMDYLEAVIHAPAERVQPARAE